MRNGRQVGSPGKVWPIGKFLFLCCSFVGPASTTPYDTFSTIAIDLWGNLSLFKCSHLTSVFTVGDGGKAGARRRS